MTDQDAKRYFAARRIYPVMNESPPSVLAGRQMPYSTWKGWWEHMYGSGETYEDYVRRAEAEKLGDAVRNYMEDRSRWSSTEAKKEWAERAG